MSHLIQKVQQNKSVKVDNLIHYTCEQPKPRHEGACVTCDGCGDIIMQGNIAYAKGGYYSASADSPLDFCSDCIVRFRLGLYLSSCGAFSAYAAARLEEEAKSGKEAFHIVATSEFDEEADYVRNGSGFLARMEMRLINMHNATVSPVLTTQENRRTVCTGLNVAFPDSTCVCQVSLKTPSHAPAFAMSREMGTYELLKIDAKK